MRDEIQHSAKAWENACKRANERADWAEAELDKCQQAREAAQARLDSMELEARRYATEAIEMKAAKEQAEAKLREAEEKIAELEDQVRDLDDLLRPMPVSKVE